MPNRMLRDWTRSDKVNSLTVNAERFFTRLIMVVDDYGRFYADPRLLKANLFPLLLDSIRDADILRWMAECQKAELIVVFENNSKKYLQIDDFRQRLRIKRQKFPNPDGSNMRTYDGHVSDISQQDVNLKRREVEDEVEEKEKAPALKNDFDKWNTMPGAGEIDLELPPIKVGAVIELFGISKNQTVSAAQVIGLWKIFKSQNFTGKKFYASEPETFSHFINWCKRMEVKDIPIEQIKGMSAREKQDLELLNSINGPGKN